MYSNAQAQRDAINIIARLMSAGGLVLGLAGTPQGVNNAVIAGLAVVGITEWSVGRVISPAVIELLCSPGMAEWNRHYREREYGRRDPILAYIRGDGPLSGFDAILSQAGAGGDINADRAAHGLLNGVVAPDGEGGAATFFGLDPAVAQAQPPHLRSLLAAALLQWLVRDGDWSGASRVNRMGVSATALEAAVAQRIIAGDTIDAVASRLDRTPPAIRRAVDRLRGKLVEAGYLARGPRLSASTIAAVCWEHGLIESINGKDIE